MRNPPRARAGRPQQQKDSQRSRHEVTRTRPMWEAPECAPGPGIWPRGSRDRVGRAERPPAARVRRRPRRSRVGDVRVLMRRSHEPCSERSSCQERAASASRPPPSTGSPCETRTRSTGQLEQRAQQSRAGRRACPRRATAPGTGAGLAGRAGFAPAPSSTSPTTSARCSRQPVGDLGRARRLQRLDPARQRRRPRGTHRSPGSRGCAAAAPSASMPRPRLRPTSAVARPCQ